MLNPEFVRRTKDLLKDEYGDFEAALETPPPVSIRTNPRKANVREGGKVSWCESGFYLPERPSFTFDPLFHAGTYYVQEASSMFLEQVFLNISDNKPVVCLDLCAAPGGKSTHLISLLPDDSLLVSNEVIRSRSVILDENMTKWGYPNKIVTNNDPKDFGELKHFFDLVIADLPCSGEGMFRKDPASRAEWSLAGVELCAERQRRIVHDVWDSLKPGGYLVYSTCTFNTEENEENMLQLAQKLEAEIITVPVKKEWNIAGSLKYDIPAYRFFPHKTSGEGFFIAVLRKNEGNTCVIKRKSVSLSKSNYQDIGVLLSPEKFHFVDNKAILKTNVPFYQHIAKCLKVVSAGINAGMFKGKDFIPSVSLALSNELDRASFPNMELSYEEAIKYLKNETVVLPDETPKGHVLVTFQNTPLGFAKQLGSRANNLYPKEWRIRNNYRLRTP